MDGITPDNIDTRNIPLDLIDASPTNPRKTIDEAKLAELGASMASPVGQIHPILVRPRDDRFEIVAGERRWRAAALAGLTTIRAEVRAIADDVVREMQLVENAGREDVHPLEEALALDGLVKCGRTPEYLADRLGRQVRWVQRRIALLGLVDEARAWLQSGRLPITHAQQLAALAPSTQQRVLARYHHERPIPSAREFARDIGYESHAVDAAPFDTEDKTLPGHGPCAKCFHRSDAQADLFSGASSDALCLDASCWNTKADASWLRVERDASKRKLTVIADPSEVFQYGDNLAWNSPYATMPPTEGARPVAVAKAPSGRAIELYAKAKAAAGRDAGDDSDDENEGDDGEGGGPSGPDKWAVKRAAEEAAERARISKLLGIASTVTGLVPMLRTALLAYLMDCSYRTFRQVLAVLDLPAADLSDAAMVESVSEGDLLRVVAVTIAAEHLGMMEEPGDEEVAPFEAELLALLKEEAPAAEAPAPVAIEPPPVLVRLWLPARPFGELTDDGRASYEHPDVVADIVWETHGDYVTAEMTAGVARIVRDLARDDGFALHEGPDAPPALTTELRVNRGAWLQHRSGLRDTAKAPLHKQWEAEGDDRVCRVTRGAAVLSQVTDYCRAHKVPLQVNGIDLLTPAVPVKPAKKNRGAKAVEA